MAKYTEDSTIQLLAGEAERMLEAYAQEPPVKERLKRLAKQAAGRSVPERDVIFWPAGMLLLGLLEAGHIDTCKAYLKAWVSEGMPVRHTDDALTGYVLVRLYEITEDTVDKEMFQSAADVIYRYLLNARTDNKGAIVYNAARDNAWIYADGIGQTAMFLSRYGTVFHRADALALAAMQISLFSQYGMDDATGLPYHGYEACSGIKYGIIGWGRAVGWLLLGTSQYASDCEERSAANRSTGENAASETPHGDAWLGVTDCARDASVLAFHRSLIENVLRYARRDGTYSWLLPAAEGPLDSSATGMITYSLVKSLRAGKATDEIENQIADMAAAVRDFVNGDRVYSCSAECTDFGQYRQQYGCYSWGQGAVLAALAIS